MDETQFFKPSQEVIDILKRLKELVPISIFTNVKPERNLNTLQAIGINHVWFTYILTGDDIQERKPALDGFHLMIERSGIPASQMLYVGDRVDVDVKPAKAVNMLTCLLYSKSAEADFCFDTFSEILQLFET